MRDLPRRFACLTSVNAMPRHGPAATHPTCLSCVAFQQQHLDIWSGHEGHGPRAQALRLPAATLADAAELAAVNLALLLGPVRPRRGLRKGECKVACCLDSKR